MQTEQIYLTDYREIETIFKRNGVKKPFLCCGKSFQQTEIFRFLKQFSPVVFDSIRPNPRYEDMQTGAALLKKEGCDFLIAAGGGSPMDTAKMVRLMATNEDKDPLSEPMENNAVKALFIPTTAGTGSEATKTSVFYLNETEKFSVHNYDFIPDYVLFDERLLETVPPYQRAATCLDALCHSIESYWSTCATEESREYAEKSIRLFFEHKESYLNNEREGNRGMLTASFYGGKAINLTGTTAPHAMCYTITMNCGTAHGHSVAVVLARLWQYMAENGDAEETLTALAEIMGGKTSADGAEIFASLLNEMKLDYPRVDITELEEYVSKVNPAKLKTNPVPMTESTIREIYRRVLCE